MGCFAVQKAKKKLGEHPPRQNEVGDVELEESTSPASSSSPASPKQTALATPPSFKRTVRAIQNAQRFINRSNPKLTASHPSYGSRDHRSSAEQATAVSDVGTLGKPMPLPSPRLSPKPTGYALPHPLDHGNVMPSSPSPLFKNTSASHAALNSRVFPWDLQPLPPPKHSFVMPSGLKSFTFEELETVCQHFSQKTLIGDDGFCFSGAIRTSGKGAKKQQEVVVLRLHEKLHLGLKEWLPELCTANRPLSSHVCNLLGFYDADGTHERLLIYEKLQKGSLHSLLFEASDTPPLDWPARMKVIHGALQGLTSLEERFPEQILYRDFRLSHVQVDSENNSKISGYWFVTCSNQNVHAHVLSNSSNARDNAYCAPETRSRGVLTWKSTVWGLGIVMLELLCGRKNKDNRIGKDEKHNLVKWARPFLLEEDKLFLIMDPKLQGRFSSKGAKGMANLILQCLQTDPTRRPSMKMALDMMKAAKETRHSGTSTWKERLHDASVPFSAPIPSSAPLPSSASSQPLKPSTLDRNTLAYTRSPTKFDLIQSPVLKPLIIPSRACAD